ncbi:fimbria/pilus outer membrane usher protein [Pseudoalteromonas ruthenica]|uniref:Fimbrial biogenesis outer membrane usher protein n=1 Tax=Pseudoalteromonas ruthenica TaxID=151081 RepID=A0A0F4PKV6_9GAMM|nr:fimbria/pilus outer membrane usher protein [Pseudoalteromonas ruthenica]KJY96022.1 hypothetical protein TW76_12620 [Pseudoalteromonas ruthenica]KJY96826.1 hypothetical protein TW72_16590 [Pseudoalteromonas ruthenica]TMO88850.1 fimbrial biogenesis outer membrane usher protein [Pseudoalteromonas ruthenica]TMO91429.1 fimbrial biogenesis outer membrane usher protein [Pseudoalteromonas ruthenica]TMP01529.1 fimbrial biogenesis outer membrane usher protein [Pseudoalteromonas ruthenica]
MAARVAPVISLCLLLLIGCCCSVAHGALNPTGQDLDLSVELVVNGANLSVVDIRIAADDTIYVDSDEFMHALTPLVLPTITRSLAQPQQKWLPLLALREQGIRVQFDMSQFLLVTSIDRQLLQSRTVSAAQQQPFLEAHKMAPYSGYLNNYLSVIKEQASKESLSEEQFTWRTELALRAHGWLLESEQQLQHGRSARASRLGTRVSYDYADIGARLSLGDNYVLGGYFQGSESSLGVAFVKNFAQITRHSPRPSASQSFTLERPSSIDVIVEQRVVKRLQLGPGVYTLADIPLQEGSNDVSLKITDDAGKVEVIEFDITTGLDLLAQGDLQLQSFAGVLSQASATGYDYLWQQPFISASFDYGWSPNLTLGAGLQWHEQSTQLSARATYAMPWFIAASEYALSHHSHLGAAQAYRASLRSYRTNSGSEFTLGYEYVAKAHTPLQISTVITARSLPVQHQWQFDYSYVFDNANTVNFSLNAQKRHRQGSKKQSWQRSATLSVGGHSWQQGWSWRVFTGVRDEGQRDYNLGFNISYQFAQGKRLRLYAQQRKHLERLEYSFQGSAQHIGVSQFTAGIENSIDYQSAVDVSMRYNGNRFGSALDHGSFYKRLQADEGRHQTRLSLSTAVAFAQNQWGVGRAINDSFALVDTHSSLDGLKVRLTDQGQAIRVKNDGLGTMLLPDLNAYSQGGAAVDIPNLPIGYDIGTGLLRFYPHYRSGHYIKVGSSANITVMGTLIDGDETPLALTVGEAVCGDDVKAFFTNRQGRFAITGMKPCRYRIRFDDTHLPSVSLEVEDEQQLQRKGVIYVR